MEGFSIGAIDDASHSGDHRRKRDLECSFLSFDVTSEDGRWHDEAIKERFRIALLRADQLRDQHQAGMKERRRADSRERFRQRLERLLEGEAYRQLDAATKERLLAEVTALVFSPKGREL
jgi:hypothetical protein